MKLNNAAQIIPKDINDIRNNLHYTLHGDYYFPDLVKSDTDHNPLGHYGRMRMDYLKEYRPGLYTRLLLSGKLYERLAEIDSTCKERMSRMIPQMAAARESTKL